jgi:tetratricopeptide (TPR) repeat protein
MIPAGAPLAVLTPESERALASLRRAILRMGGFGFYVVLSGDLGRVELLRRLRAWSGTEGIPELHFFPEGKEAAAKIDRFLAESDRKHPLGGAVIPDGGALFEVDGGSIYGALNIARDMLGKLVQGPLVLVIPEHRLKDLVRLATDLFEVRLATLLVEREHTPVPPSPERVEEGRARRVALAEPNMGVATIFVGRDDELREIEAALLPATGEVQPVALQGMPGVGKSYLADRFAYLHKDRFPGGYVKLSLSPEEKRSTEALGGDLAARLGQNLWGTDQAWAMLRARLLSPRVLLHIENADGDEAAAAAMELASRLAECAVIVSGRFQGLGLSRPWRRVEVPVLDEEAALMQLAKEIAPPLWAKIRAEDRSTLVGELGYLPLALHLAAGYLRRGQSIDRLLQLFRAEKLSLSQDPAQVERIVGLALERSIRLLGEALGDKAETWLPAFFALGEAPPSGVGRSLGAAIAGLKEHEFEELMSRAEELSLVQRLPDGERSEGAWRVHPLLAALLRQRSDGRGLEGMTRWFLARLRKGGEDQGLRWNQIQREEEALITWLGRVPPENKVRVLKASLWYPISNGPYPAWLDFSERLLQERNEPDIRSSALWTLSHIALRSDNLDRAYDAAREMSRLNLARGAKRETAIAAGLIAEILTARGDLDEALRTWREDVLPVFESLGEARARAVTLGKIADILVTRGDLDEALRIRREEELPVYERLGEVRERAIALGKVADILMTRGEIDEALRIIREEELPVFERLGERHSLVRDRINMTHLLLKRDHPTDRREAASLLALALRDAEVMHIPEADQIRAIQKRHGL